MPEAFTNLITEVWTQNTALVATITASSILLIPVGFRFANGVIGIAKSLMGTRGRGRR